MALRLSMRTLSISPHTGIQRVEPAKHADHFFRLESLTVKDTEPQSLP